jgi:hypothetical protein
MNRKPVFTIATMAVASLGLVSCDLKITINPARIPAAAVTPVSATVPPPSPASSPLSPLGADQSTDVPALGPALSEAVMTMDSYFGAINNARSSHDLHIAWELLTRKLQCNPNDNCDYRHFESWWWDWMVAYELFDCGNNQVDVKLLYYARGSSGPSASREPTYVHYELIHESGMLKLNSGELIDRPGADCQWTP